MLWQVPAQLRIKAQPHFRLKPFYVKQKFIINCGETNKV